MKPTCAITILEKLKADVKAGEWVNITAQIRVASGVQLAIDKLHNEGFLKIEDDELNIAPVEKRQLEFNLQ